MFSIHIVTPPGIKLTTSTSTASSQPTATATSTPNPPIQPDQSEFNPDSLEPQIMGKDQSQDTEHLQRSANPTFGISFHTDTDPDIHSTFNQSSHFLPPQTPGQFFPHPSFSRNQHQPFFPPPQCSSPLPRPFPIPPNLRFPPVFFPVRPPPPAFHPHPHPQSHAHPHPHPLYLHQQRLLMQHQQQQQQQQQQQRNFHLQRMMADRKAWEEWMIAQGLAGGNATRGRFGYGSEDEGMEGDEDGDDEMGGSGGQGRFEREMTGGVGESSVESENENDDMTGKEVEKSADKDLKGRNEITTSPTSNAEKEEEERARRRSVQVEEITCAYNPAFGEPLTSNPFLAAYITSINQDFNSRSTTDPQSSQLEEPLGDGIRVRAMALGDLLGEVEFPTPPVGVKSSKGKANGVVSSGGFGSGLAARVEEEDTTEKEEHSRRSFSPSVAESDSGKEAMKDKKVEDRFVMVSPTDKEGPDPKARHSMGAWTSLLGGRDAGRISSGPAAAFRTNDTVSGREGESDMPKPDKREGDVRSEQMKMVDQLMAASGMSAADLVEVLKRKMM